MGLASPLTAKAHELQAQLEAGELTSVDLVRVFLSQIKKHNHEGLKLNAVLSVCPKDSALAEAARLDKERRDGKVRSKLHGIPIIIKDAIATDAALGMVSTAGAAAFAEMKAKKNSTVAQRLIDAGLIILGKGNMTEFCGIKSEDTPIGWSAYGGQTLSVYRREGLDDKDQAISAGSSSGPAVSIVAGFSPLGIGTETGGSNILPASVSGLYGLTFTRHSVPTDGVLKISRTYDAIGLMARDPRDLAALADVLRPSEREGGGYASEMDGTWEGLSVGIVKNTWGVQVMPEGLGKPAKWVSPEVVEKYNNAAETMKAKAAKVVFPLDLQEPGIFKYEGETAHTVSYFEFPENVKEFISIFEDHPKIKSLADIIEWNKQNPEKGMPEPFPGQTELVAALNSTMTTEKHDKAAAALRNMATEAIEQAMGQHGLDVVLAPSDSVLVSYAMLPGWPIATVPLGNLAKNGQPFGFFVLAPAGKEAVLLRFMAAFHRTFPAVQAPTACF